MALAWTVKPWERTFGGRKVQIPVGRRVKIDLRSELEEGLASGALTQDALRGKAAQTQAAIAASSPRQRQRQRSVPFRARKDPRLSEVVKDLAEKLGLPQEGAWAQYEAQAKVLGPDATAEDVCRAVRAVYGALTLDEIVEDLAKEVGEVPEELLACLQHHASRLDRLPSEIADWYRFAAEVEGEHEGLDYSEVFDKLAALTRRGRYTVRDAMRLLRVELLQGEIKDRVEAGGGLLEGSVIKVTDLKHALYGVPGKVKQLLANGQYRVTFPHDPDQKAYRVLRRDQIGLEVQEST